MKNLNFLLPENISVNFFTSLARKKKTQHFFLVVVVIIIFVYGSDGLCFIL